MVSAAEVDVCAPEPVSRSFQYRRVVKPQLERQRRARVTKCLDALRDLMAEALQDNKCGPLEKLEKADVLELTVEHLKKLRDQGALQSPMPLAQQEDKFREGYTRCATEVAHCLTTLPGALPQQVNVTLGARLMAHLGTSFTHHEKRAPLTITVPQQTSVFTHSGQQPQGLLMASTSPCSTPGSATSPSLYTPSTSPPLYTPPASPVSASQQTSPPQTRLPTSPVWRPW